MRRIPWPGLAVAATGAAVVALAQRLLATLETVRMEPDHYRVAAALRWGAHVPHGEWWHGVVGGLLVGSGLWVITRLAVRSQGRSAGWPQAVALVGCWALASVLFLRADLTTRPGRFVAVAAAGLAGPGTCLVWVALLLDACWTRGWVPSRSTVAVLSGILCLVAGAWMTAVHEATGDEPSYLLVMHSLVHDGDIDVGNNHLQQDYRSFYPTTLTHGQMLTTRVGMVVPKHSLGLPVLGAVPYALAGRWGVSVLCALLAAAYAGSVWSHVASRAPALAGPTWAAVLCSAPLLTYSGQIYPHVATGLLLMASLRLPPLWAGVCLGAVPWFHLGTGVLAVGTWVVLALRRPRAAVPLTVVPALMWAALAALHWYFWGRLLPPVDVYGKFSVSALPVGLAGLLMDQEAGLVWASPVWVGALGYLVFPPGAQRGLALVTAGWICYVASFNWWYGGWCPTGRFLVPVLGSLAILLSHGVRCPWVRWCWWVSVALTAALVAFPFARFNAHDGTNALLDALGPAGRAAARLMPSVVEPRPVPWLAWGALIVLIAAVTRRCGRSW